MRLLGVIPARGGSKGIPRKNLAPAAGRPLLVWTCEAALASERLDRIVVSTDDDETAALARACGIEVPFLRPARLATDDTPMLDVLLHALDETGDSDGAVLLQPTSPLRLAEDIDGAVDLLMRSDADSVVTVVQVPHAFAPSSLLRLEEGRIVPLFGGKAPLRRQDKPAVYARNGPAVLAVRTATLRRGSLYGDDCRAYEMPPERSLDVDTPFELELASLLLEHRT